MKSSEPVPKIRMHQCTAQLIINPPNLHPRANPNEASKPATASPISLLVRIRFWGPLYYNVSIIRNPPVFLLLVWHRPFGLHCTLSAKLKPSELPTACFRHKEVSHLIYISLRMHVCMHVFMYASYIYIYIHIYNYMYVYIPGKPVTPLISAGTGQNILCS